MLRLNSNATKTLASCALLPAVVLWCGGAAAQVAFAPYKLTTFAKGTSAYSQPDSIERWHNSVLVGYQNHVAKDGTDGKSSTIVQYSLDGSVQRTFSVVGHNDGLRVVGEDKDKEDRDKEDKDKEDRNKEHKNKLWALQNEDANPSLAVIDLDDGSIATYTLAAPHGGGYDDLRVLHGEVFMTASNPNLDAHGVNVFPALVRAKLSGGSVDLVPVLYGNASATNIATGQPETLNLTDPDSLSIDPAGNLVVNSQADAVLVFVHRPLKDDQAVGVLHITLEGSQSVDDTAFAPRGHSFALFSDIGLDTVYRLDRPVFGFEGGTPYSTSDSFGIVSVLNLDYGFLTPIASGFNSTRGMIFIKKEESERERDDDRREHSDDHHDHSDDHR